MNASYNDFYSKIWKGKEKKKMITHPPRVSKTHHLRPIRLRKLPMTFLTLLKVQEQVPYSVLNVWGMDT